MFKGTRGIELALAALAVIIGAAIIISAWLGGFIAPQSVFPDLVAYLGMLLLLALGATLDVLATTTGSKVIALILLTVGALALTGWFVISFVTFFGAPALLAVVVTLLAYARLGERRLAAAPSTR